MAREWSELVAPMVARCELAAKLGMNATWNPDGAEALGKLLREMADLLDLLARSADKYQSSYSETAHLARYGAATIRKLIRRGDGEHAGMAKIRLGYEETSGDSEEPKR